MQIFHDHRCVAYGRAGHPERPQRISGSAALLRAQHPEWPWRQSEMATREELLRSHSPEHLNLVANARQDLDADCPAYADIYQHAARAAGCAIATARAAASGQRGFSLMRPPGHHASRDLVMGFCYFNHIALAAFDALDRGAKRVAIWDFDAHHGNGTEALVAGHEQIRFASIHQYPGWPGTGMSSFGNIYNYPIAPFSERKKHVAAVQRALDKLLEFEPELLLVSAGFDAYRDDPITEMTLEREDFSLFGTRLREADIPGAAILEGGYSDELPELIDAFLSSWNH